MGGGTEDGTHKAWVNVRDEEYVIMLTSEGGGGGEGARLTRVTVLLRERNVWISILVLISVCGNNKNNMIKRRGSMTDPPRSCFHHWSLKPVLSQCRQSGRI